MTELWFSLLLRCQPLWPRSELSGSSEISNRDNQEAKGGVTCLKTVPLFANTLPLPPSRGRGGDGERGAVRVTTLSPSPFYQGFRYRQLEMPSEKYPFTPLRSMSNTLELVSLGGVEITTIQIQDSPYRFHTLDHSRI